MADNPMAQEATTLLEIGGDVDDFGKHQSEFGIRLFTHLRPEHDSQHLRPPVGSSRSGWRSAG
jgi:hypothetical protein